jgi:putative transposase
MRYHSHYKTGGTGHLHQGRFKSFPIQDDDHLWMAMRYVERNPIRANFVGRAEDWAWRSARMRHQPTENRRWLTSPVAQPLPSEWSSWVNNPEPEAELTALRHCNRRGLPSATTTGSKTAPSALDSNLRSGHVDNQKKGSDPLRLNRHCIPLRTLGLGPVPSVSVRNPSSVHVDRQRDKSLFSLSTSQHMTTTSSSFENDYPSRIVLDETFQGNNLSILKLEGYTFRNCSFNLCDLTGAVFKQCAFRGIVIENSNLRDARFIDCQFEDVAISTSTLVLARFLKTSMKSCKVYDCECGKSEFTGDSLPTEIVDTEVSLCNLDNSSWQNLVFRRCNFTFNAINNQALLMNVTVDSFTSFEGTNVELARCASELVIKLKRNKREANLLASYNAARGISKALKYVECQFWIATGYDTSFRALLVPSISVWVSFSILLFLSTISNSTLSFGYIRFHNLSGSLSSSDCWPTFIFSIIEHLVTCFYYVLVTTTTLGYGDIYPTTIIAKIYVIILLMTGYAVFTLIATRIAKSITD